MPVQGHSMLGVLCAVSPTSCRKGTGWAEALEAMEAQPSSHPGQFPAASSLGEFLIPSVPGLRDELHH